MGEAAGEQEGAQYIDRLREARDRAAVLKMQLAALRSARPNTIVLVFEGDDDKIVYGQWLRRLRPDITYEPLPCSGKDMVLKLKDALLRDKNNLIDGVYFFVDRDFYDLKGHAHHERIFMTDMYAVENYIVNKETVSHLLTNEFHCHARPALREQILSRFDELYAGFIEITRIVNFHIYVHRVCAVDISSADMPKKIGQLASVRSNAVEEPEIKPEARLLLPAAVEGQRIDALREEFERLDGVTRYRGKFALLFFKRWLEELAKEYRAKGGGVFAGLDRTAAVREREFVLSNFASLAAVPDGLPAFVQNLQPPLAA